MIIVKIYTIYLKGIRSELYVTINTGIELLDILGILTLQM